MWWSMLQAETLSCWLLLLLLALLLWSMTAAAAAAVLCHYNPLHVFFTG